MTIFAVLNVAGSRATEDRGIYDEVFRIIAGVIQMETAAETAIESHSDGYPEIHLDDTTTALPRSVDEAIDGIISDMSLEERVHLANLNEDELLSLEN